MPIQIEIPDQDEIDTWDIRERGIRAGTSSPSEAFEVDQTTAERQFSCLWSKRKDVFKWFVGYSQLYEELGATKLSRLMPQTHPDLPGLYASKITDVQGHVFDGVAESVDAEDPYREDPLASFDHPDYRFTNTQINKYHRATFTVFYEQAPFLFAIDEDATDELTRYVSLDSPEPSAEALTLPGACFKYQKSGGGGPSGVGVPFNTSRVEPLEVRKVTWHRLPEEAYEPGSALYDRIYGDGTTRPYLGTINKTEFRGFPPHSLLFSAVRPVRRKSPTGSGVEYDLTYELTYKPSLWSRLFYFDPAGTNSGYYFVTATGAYEAPGSLTDDKNLYNEREFAHLFVVGTV